MANFFKYIYEKAKTPIAKWVFLCYDSNVAKKSRISISHW